MRHDANNAATNQDRSSKKGVTLRNGGIYYGWILIVTLGITETISWGVLYYAFTVYIQPMAAELGWSRAALTGALSVALLLAGVSAIPAGRWLDRHGPRLLMTVGSVAATLLVLAWSQVHNLAAFYLIWAAIGVTMSATLYDPAFAVANRWFERRRVQALTVITLMAGFASTVFIPLSGWLVQIGGWRQSLLILALVLAIGTIPAHALLLRRRPEDLGLHPDGLPPMVARVEQHVELSMPVGEAVRHASFRWLTISLWLATVCTAAVGVHLLPYLEDRGYDATLAATVTGSLGAMQVLARLLVTGVGNRLSPRVLGAVILALQPASLLFLLLVRSTPGVIAFVVLFGAQRGLTTLIRPALVADLYGAARYASIAGVLQFALSLAQAAAPFAAGAAYDALGTYEPIFGVLIAVSAVGALAIFGARRDPEEKLKSSS